MNRQQQGIAVSNALLALVEQLSGMPGRKTVVLFSEGFEIPDSVKQKFDEVEDRANRHNVSFYTMDAAGLRVHSRMPLIARPSAKRARRTSAAASPTIATVDAPSDVARSHGRPRAAGPTHRWPVHRRHERPEGAASPGSTPTAASTTCSRTRRRTRRWTAPIARSTCGCDAPGMKIRARGGYVASPIGRTDSPAAITKTTRWPR